MLTITPCLEKATVAAYCKKAKRPYTEALYLYRAENRGELLAAALFEIDADTVQVLFYESAEPEDDALFDGVLRAGIHYAAEQGISNGFISEAFRLRHSGLFTALPYPIHTVFNITNFFQKYKKCREI